MLIVPSLCESKPSHLPAQCHVGTQWCIYSVQIHGRALTCFTVFPCWPPSAVRGSSGWARPIAFGNHITGFQKSALVPLVSFILNLLQNTVECVHFGFHKLSFECNDRHKLNPSVYIGSAIEMCTCSLSRWLRWIIQDVAQTYSATLKRAFDWRWCPITGNPTIPCSAPAPMPSPS